MTITREQGYAIEGDPKPIDDTAPERLRERREALGLSRRGMAVIAQRHETGDVHWEPEDIRICEIPANPPHRASGRATYAAALSAAEAERAAKPDHLAYADSPVWDDGPLPTPTPERPAPRFKVGEWVRVTNVAQGGDARCIGVEFRILSVFESDGRDIYVSPKYGTWEASHLEPASPPAPEVVDVPQPIVKRCACSDIHDDVEAEWRPGEPYLTVTHTTIPLALLRAMLEAIDAQQGGAS